MKLQCHIFAYRFKLMLKSLSVCRKHLKCLNILTRVSSAHQNKERSSCKCMSRSGWFLILIEILNLTINTRSQFHNYRVFIVYRVTFYSKCSKYPLT